MILGEHTPERDGADGETTLVDLFRRAAARRPHAPALCDPVNRADFTGGAPRSLTYTEADRAVSAIAARLRSLGLPADSVVGIVLPNTIECVLTILGVVRAGMIAAPLPLLWQGAQARQALAHVGVKAIVTCTRVGDLDPCGLAMQVAADLFSIRQVCAFGSGVPDGFVPLDDLLTAASSEFAAVARAGEPARHVALVTFDVTPNGMVAAARDHARLIAAGRTVMLEGGLADNVSILGACALSSFAGIVLTVMPWLLSGGSLSLHHGFEAKAFAAQGVADNCGTAVVRGPALPQLEAAGLFDRPRLRHVLAAWRSPERLAVSPAFRHPNADLADVLVFGEIGLVGGRRDDEDRPLPLRGSPQAEIARTDIGTLALRGPMIPHHPFPPGADPRSVPLYRTTAAGFVDSGYACRPEGPGGALRVTAPPPGLISIGGYRFVLSEVEDLVRQLEGGAFITALPDAVAGYRLAGIAADGTLALADLAARGANRLVTGAFHSQAKAA